MSYSRSMEDNDIDPRAPIVTKEQIWHVAWHKQAKYKLVKETVNKFNLKSDTYDGVIAGIVQIIDYGDEETQYNLRNRLFSLLTDDNQRYGCSIFLRVAVNKLILERPKFVIGFFESLFKKLLKCSYDFHLLSPEERLKLKITAIKFIRQAEHARGGRPTLIEEVELERLCLEALNSLDDETKINTLIFILDSKETTKKIDDFRLSIFKTLLQDAVGLQKPALRQIFIAQTSKLLKRINDSYRVVKRDDPRDHVIVTLRYTTFLRWLVSFCIDRIYCKTYFGTFVLTISIIKLVIKLIETQDLRVTIDGLLSSRRCCDSILSCVGDSFEENKLRAIETLELLSPEKLDQAEIESIAYKLTSSVNPAQSLTCQYLFKLLRFLNRKNIQTDDMGFSHLDNLVQDVEDCLVSTSDGILPYISSKPIHSKLACIRALLEEVDLERASQQREKWQPLAHKIVQVSIKACHAVAAVVCNLNPETVGHLPMDLQPVDVSYLLETTRLSEDASNANFGTMTSQMLLICGWKTIKETALSLGTFCARLWWPTDCTKLKFGEYPSTWVDPILNETDILSIIAFFEHYLMNLRHRGAFEQAYNGFLMVTKRIWHEPAYREVLLSLLDKLLADFKEESLDVKKRETLKAYITRRSAGLPYLVQAILNSESAHDTRALRSVMDCLFEVLESNKSEDYQKVHCLNILRALIKEHHLGEKVVPYIGRTFALTLDMLISTSFPIRNCANMLLKSTMDRTFGVNRLRDQIHRQNCLSYERFFSMCPELHSKMLEIISIGPNERRYFASIRAVFTILSRLVTSKNPSEQYRPEIIVRPFIEPSLDLVFNCNDFKLRQQAARMVTLLETNLIGERREPLPQRMRGEKLVELSGYYDNNTVHGALELITRQIEIEDRWYTKARQQAIQPSHVTKVLRSIIAVDGLDKLAISKCTALDLAESYYLYSYEPKEWLVERARFALELTLVDTFLPDEGFDPFGENYILKLITLIFLSNDSENPKGKHLHRTISIVMRLIKMKHSRTISTSLQGSLIRFLRHQLAGVVTVTEKLMDRLEMDWTAHLETPGDKMKEELTKGDNPNISGTIFKKDRALRKFLLSYNEELHELMDLSVYEEFQPDKLGSFRPKNSNTPRAVELLALGYDSWADLEELYSAAEVVDKLHLMTKFISDLPDCDVKSVALLYSSKLLTYCLNNKLWHATKDLTQLVRDLASQDNSSTVKFVCCQVLMHNLASTLTCSKDPIENWNHRDCLINLMGAFIKLYHDEDNDLQEATKLIMLELSRCFPRDKHKAEAYKTHSGRMDGLLDLITGRLFNPDLDEEAADCFTLLMSAIFMRPEDSLSCSRDETERLFYGSQPDNYVNLVATIQSCFRVFQQFFARRDTSLARVKLDDLVIPIVQASSSSTGIENTCRGKLGDANQIKPLDIPGTTSQLVDQIALSIYEGLDYFSSGYQNILVDPNYTYRELCIYKKIACLVIVVRHTEHNMQNVYLLDQIRDRLFNIVRMKSATSILSKSYELVQM